MATEDWPQMGAVVLDTGTDRVGVVLGSNARTVSLRPAGGGEPWNVRRDAVRPASPLDELRARVAEINARRRWIR
jgi:hypothetical protein